MFGRLDVLEFTQQITNETSINLKINLVVIFSPNAFIQDLKGIDDGFRNSNIIEVIYDKKLGAVSSFSILLIDNKGLMIDI